MFCVKFKPAPTQGISRNASTEARNAALQAASLVAQVFLEACRAALALPEYGSRPFLLPTYATEIIVVGVSSR